MKHYQEIVIATDTLSGILIILNSKSSLKHPIHYPYTIHTLSILDALSLSRFQNP
ncbi:hypothetical protein [Flavobacterium taihuense]|uniref:Uncharacterized protein n=1 Tax=Flavobacterium taihuense TaxID=2857508 RepID=A0ABS6XWL6_9FLAO|nr:hypothetical protein [Flavobacterium taihuense]MBW4361032.1 hypothetical protein [Flavobacterium taihuense]